MNLQDLLCITYWAARWCYCTVWCEDPKITITIIDQSYAAVLLMINIFLSPYNSAKHSVHYCTSQHTNCFIHSIITFLHSNRYWYKIWWWKENERKKPNCTHSSTMMMRQKSCMYLWVGVLLLIHTVPSDLLISRSLVKEQTQTVVFEFSDWTGVMLATLASRTNINMSNTNTLVCIRCLTPQLLLSIPRLNLIDFKL